MRVSPCASAALRAGGTPALPGSQRGQNHHGLGAKGDARAPRVANLPLYGRRHGKRIAASCGIQNRDSQIVRRPRNVSARRFRNAKRSLNTGTVSVRGVGRATRREPDSRAVGRPRQIEGDESKAVDHATNVYRTKVQPYISSYAPMESVFAYGVNLHLLAVVSQKRDALTVHRETSAEYLHPCLLRATRRRARFAVPLGARGRLRNARCERLNYGSRRDARQPPAHSREIRESPCSASVGAVCGRFSFLASLSSLPQIALSRFSP